MSYLKMIVDGRGDGKYFTFNSTIDCDCSNGNLIQGIKTLLKHMYRENPKVVEYALGEFLKEVTPGKEKE